MAALVAVMIMVSIGTFSWRSLRQLREHPPSSSIVMLATVVVTVATHDLAQGVFVGVLLSGLFFANKVGRILRVDRSLSTDGRTRTYGVVGQVEPVLCNIRNRESVRSVILGADAVVNCSPVRVFSSRISFCFWSISTLRMLKWNVTLGFSSASSISSWLSPPLEMELMYWPCSP
jgi:MFS superfamily sulfate permease-like transporter